MYSESRYIYNTKNKKTIGAYDWAMPYIDYLTPTQAKYLRGRNEGESFNKIGKMYGLSRQGVYDTLNKALRRLDRQILDGKVYKVTPKKASIEENV